MINFKSFFNKINEDRLDELSLSNPYKFVVKMNGARSVIVEFETDVSDKGLYYSYRASFSRYGETNGWTLVFKSLQSKDVSSDDKKIERKKTYGNISADIPALRVFATIKEILKKFITLHPEFETITFTGSDQQRDRLYRMGMPRIADELGIDYDNVGQMKFINKQK